MDRPLPGDWAVVNSPVMIEYLSHSLQSISYLCGYCGNAVASDRGLDMIDGNHNSFAILRICPSCLCPTYIESGTKQFPQASPGHHVEGLSAEIGQLYDEGRRCMASNAPTSAVLAMRKILMHVAVELGAPPGRSFKEYVDYLAKSGHIPEKGKVWVNHIRDKGNEANHDIVLMDPKDADELLIFTEMMLKIIYEFPKRLSPKP